MGQLLTVVLDLMDERNGWARLAVVALVIASLFGLNACGGSAQSSTTNSNTNSAPPPGPTSQVTTVTLTPASQSISSGSTATLNWSATSFGKLTVPGIGDTTQSSGTVTVAPTETTTYTATAISADGTQIAEAAATVSLGGTAPPAPPSLTLTTSATTVAAGQPVTVTWAAQNATAMTFSPAITGANLTVPNGKVTFTPTATTTYSATAASASGASITVQLTITVQNSPSATFSIAPSAITTGQTAVLTWTTQNATQVAITPAISGAPSPLPLNDTTGLTVSPSATTTYTLVATGTNGTQSQPYTATVTVNAPTSLSAIGHIVFALQENRSFDNYFGMLNKYRAAHNLPTDADTLTNPDGSIKALSNVGYNAGKPGPAIPVFAMKTMCIQALSPAWNEVHTAADLNNPASNIFLNDGFAFVAGKFSVNTGVTDTIGQRAMGYYDWNALPYYYYLASTYATSDRWFSPAPTNTPANRMYMYAATSNGHIYEATAPQNIQTIFNLLQNAGVTWRLYAEDPTLAGLYGYTPLIPYADHIAPLSQFATDALNGKLPQVATIETSTSNEHPDPGQNIQQGASVMAGLVNAFMKSSAWKDGVFILSYDEAGNLYDHVAPQMVVSPDGIPPQDMKPGDIAGDFTRTGFRLPFMLVSPFAKSHYVSHTPRDHTSILKLIEQRFGLPALTKRDAAQQDMGEFFDFSAPNLNTPTTSPPPVQPTNGPCYSNTLP